MPPTPFSRSFLTFSGPFGLVFTHSDTFGYIRMHSEEKKLSNLKTNWKQIVFFFKTIAKFLNVLAIFFDVFARFSKLLDVFGPIRIRSDLLGCVFSPCSDVSRPRRLVRGGRGTSEGGGKSRIDPVCGPPWREDIGGREIKSHTPDSKGSVDPHCPIKDNPRYGLNK